VEPLRDRQLGNSRQEVQAHAECGRGRWPARGERRDARFRVVVPQARPPRSRGAAACDAAASAASCSGLGLCWFLRDGVDSVGFCDLYYGLKEDYSGGDAAGERWRSEHAK